jgi:hypothetical protein
VNSKGEKRMTKYSNKFKLLKWSTGLMLTGVIAACGGGGGGGSGSGAGSGPTGEACVGGDCVPLGTAANYVILASTGVSTTGTTAVTGNIGLSPAAGSFFTGWNETANGAPVTYSTSVQVAAPGKMYAADYPGGTTSVDLTTAVGDMETAYTTANGMAPAGGGIGTACPGAGILDGLTIVPGVYTCTVNLSIGANVALSGAGVYVIRTTQGLTQASATQVQLSSGALAKNVFWVVAGGVDIGTTATMQGVILGKTLINLQTGATANGRLLAQTAVTLDAATVTIP